MNNSHNETMKLLYEALVHVKNNVDQLDPSYGICGALATHFSPKYKIIPWDSIDEFCYSWEKFSGDKLFPVPSTIEGKCLASCYGEHRVSGTLWVGEQGTLRLELLDHLISETQKCIDNETVKSTYQESIK